MIDTFDAIGLRPELVQTLTEMGHCVPTVIQSELIPTMLAGRDVIGQSQTGTGKTAAFLIPIFQLLLTDMFFWVLFLKNVIYFPFFDSG